VQPSWDCASLLARYDQRAQAAAAEQVNASMAARETGEKLCLEGRIEDGAAKLNEAIRQISVAAPPVP
jgi:hypothetical protein